MKAIFSLILMIFSFQLYSQYIDLSQNKQAGDPILLNDLHSNFDYL